MDDFKEKLKNFIDLNLEEDNFLEIINISNPEQLMDFWWSSSSDINFKKVIENQINEIIYNIQSDKIPKWFRKIISGEKIVPKIIKNEIKLKAIKLYNIL